MKKYLSNKATVFIMYMIKEHQSGNPVPSNFLDKEDLYQARRLRKEGIIDGGKAVDYRGNCYYVDMANPKIKSFVSQLGKHDSDYCFS